MNSQIFDAQYDAFVKASRESGRIVPELGDQIPVLNDDGDSHTGNDYAWDYVLHCNWAARSIAKHRPSLHADFGSYVYFAAICQPFLPFFSFSDIRSILEIPGLRRRSDDLTHIRLNDGEHMSISCLHVLEHVGLGRYGDTLDANGDRKAARELVRILAPGGRLLMVLPMADTERINFNAHRIYTLGTALKMFEPLTVSDSCFLYNGKVNNAPPNSAGDFTGCLELTK